MTQLSGTGARRVGPYQVVRRLGAGGMGVVYLAESPGGVLVALKVMHPAWVAEPGFPDRFEREVEAIRRVSPFCTAPVLDASVSEDEAYIVTEYVEGRTLWETVKEGGPLAGARLESVAVGTAVALTAIHRAGIVHRDLKPGNVILSPEGARVIDFGIAKLADANPITGNVAMGTPPFMSPEQASGEEVTPASDVFAWGSVVTFAGTGEPPFGRGSAPVMFYRLLNEEPRLGELPGRLRALVASALDKRPERRPAARELIDELVGRPVGESAAAAMFSTGLRVPADQTAPSEDEEPKTEPGLKPRRRGWRGRWIRLRGKVAFSRRRRWSAATADGSAAFSGRRRWIAALAAGLAVLAGVATYEAFGTSGTTSSSTTVFHDEFKGRGNWPSAETAAGTARYFSDGYLLQPLPDQGMAATAPVAADQLRTIRVSTAARMQIGNGQYGLWCGGTPVANAQSRYTFAITTDGRAGITKEGRGGARWELVPFRNVPGILPSGENRIEAECRFRPEGTTLRMLVNGRQVASFRDRWSAYGPGAVGVSAISQAGAALGATARYEEFTVRRLPE